jgi:hypothetical protein
MKIFLERLGAVIVLVLIIVVSSWSLYSPSDEPLPGFYAWQNADGTVERIRVSRLYRVSELVGTDWKSVEWNRAELLKKKALTLSGGASLDDN